MIATSEAFQDAITAPSQSLVVNVTHVATDTPLIVNSGSVTLDANADARGRAEFTVVNEDGTHDPANADDILSPYNNEFSIEIGRVLTDGIEETVPCGVFGVDSVTDNGHEFSVQLVDRTRRFLDAKLLRPHEFAKDSAVDDNILEILNGAGFVYEHDFDTTTATLSMGPVVAEEQEDRWGIVKVMASADGKVAYFDRSGVLVLRPEQPESSPALTITTTDNLVTLDRSWSRDQAVNWVKVESSAADDTEVVSATAVDADATSPTNIYAFGPKPMWYSNAYVQTEAQCENVANALLQRHKGIAYQVSLESMATPALDPLDVIRVEWPERNIYENHVVDSVTIPLTGGALSVATRAIQGGLLG